MGELHLDVLVDRMRREFGVEANIGKPQVAYRETIRQTIEHEAKYIRQTGGRGQYGHVWVKLEPTYGEEDAENFEFVDAIVGGVVPREYIPAVAKGLEEQMDNGVIAGYPLINVRATLYDGSFHEVDSSEMAFKIAGSMAMREGAQRGQPGPARARDGRRGRHPGGLHGRRRRRLEPQARHDRRHGRESGGQDRAGIGTARGDVRLLERTCARQPRGVRPSPWSSSATRRCRTTSPKGSSRRRDGP